MPKYADTSNYTEDEIRFWDWLTERQNVPFTTLRGLEFTVSIKGNELFIDRKKKGLTRATVNIALRKAREIGVIRKTPKELGTFGASYLMPLFVSYGAVKNLIPQKSGIKLDMDDLFPGF